jgi:hypothetical protein
LDSEYILLAFLLCVLGITGILLFNGPKTPAGDGCYCIISSPEGGAMQGTSSILLIFGVMFIPIGVLKGGLPQRRKVAPAPRTVASGRVFTPVSFSSGVLFGFGLLILFVALDFIVIPAYLVLQNMFLVGGGVALAAAGAYLAYRGARPRKA